MISANTRAIDISNLVSTKEGVSIFHTLLLQNLIKKLKSIPQERITPDLSRKLSMGVTHINIKASHLLYSETKSHSPEKVNKEAWAGFALANNVHKYKSRSMRCNKCKEKGSVKVQAGVDVGVATRLAEVVLGNVTAKRPEDITDLVILIGGDRDFKDMLDLCKRFQANVFLVGFKENVYEGIKESVANFFDIRDLLEGMPKLPSRLVRPRNVVVKVKGYSLIYRQEEFLRLLSNSGILPQVRDWKEDRDQPGFAYILLAFCSEDEAKEAIDFVRLYLFLCVKYLPQNLS